MLSLEYSLCNYNIVSPCFTEIRLNCKNDFLLGEKCCNFTSNINNISLYTITISSERKNLLDLRFFNSSKITFLT